MDVGNRLTKEFECRRSTSSFQFFISDLLCDLKKSIIHFPLHAQIKLVIDDQETYGNNPPHELLIILDQKRYIRHTKLKMGSCRGVESFLTLFLNSQCMIQQTKNLHINKLNEFKSNCFRPSQDILTEFAKQYVANMLSATRETIIRTTSLS